MLLISVSDSPPLLREAADSLVGRIPTAERLELEATGVEATGEAFSLLVSP